MKGEGKFRHFGGIITFEPHSFMLFIEKEALLETGQQMSNIVSKRIGIKIL